MAIFFNRKISQIKELMIKKILAYLVIFCLTFSYFTEEIQQFWTSVSLKYGYHNSSSIRPIWKISCVKHNQVCTQQSKVSAGFWNLFLSNTSDLYAHNLLCDTTQMFTEIHFPPSTQHTLNFCVLYVFMKCNIWVFI